MTDSLKVAEQMVQRLIADANEAHDEDCWTYELTSDVDNIEVSSGSRTRTLRVHPCWLRYVVSHGEFASCVAGEIEAWYLLAELTAA